MLAADLAVAGLAVGGIAAISGIGLIVTYRATGVFNLAFGAIGMFAAYLLWQAVRVWHWPLPVAAVVDLAVVAPGMGVLLDRLVFRRLQRRGAAPAEKLVASLGVFILLVGIAYLVWGSAPKQDVPSLFGTGRVSLGGATTMSADTVAELVIVVVVAVGAVVLRRFTGLGLRMRAVVDSRELAELSRVNADRVAALGWAGGATLAGLAGVLLAPALSLSLYDLTLQMMETMVVAVAALLTYLPVAVVVALVLGVGQSELAGAHVNSTFQGIVSALSTNLFPAALLVVLLLLPSLGEIGARDAGVTAALTRRRSAAITGWWLPLAALAVVPFAFDAPDLQLAQQVPAMAIIFLSLVAVTGYAGQISLGQAGYAGLGALFSAKLAAGSFLGIPAMPGLAALFVGAFLVTPVGLITGWPAIRRRGLFLALTTFAVGAVVSRFVFQQPLFTSDLVVNRPAPFTSPRAFYGLELICLLAGLALVHNLHTGRLGRALLAVRDHEVGAEASGVAVARLKVFVFAVSGGLAGLGGALLTQSGGAFDPSMFDPIQGMLWFAAVVVFGVDSAAGAILAAVLLVGLNQGGQTGASTVVIGLLAVLLGLIPGGVTQTADQLTRRLAARVNERGGLFTPAPGHVRRPPEATVPIRPGLRLTPAGLAAAERVRRRRGTGGDVGGNVAGGVGPGGAG